MAWFAKGPLSGDRLSDRVRRSMIIAIVSFLSLIDLFGAQALLPQLVSAYRADPQLMGVAVNASTLGMAASGLVVAWFADRIDRKRGIWVSLVLLAIPTFGLGLAETVEQFMALRIAQGVFMAAAFTLTLTYLSEQCDVTAAGGAMAAYITGNVASNLFGRLMAVSAADTLGLAGSFWLFAALNLTGAVVAWLLIGGRDTTPPARGDPPTVTWRRHLSSPTLRAAFAIGFAILFIFVGVFTYVNLYLVDVVGLDPMQLGVAYFVFLPALVTTLYAASAVNRFGPQRVLVFSCALVVLGLGLTLIPKLWSVLTGLAIIGASTFFMQAAATGYVGRAATRDHAAANGLYLTSYYLGGLAGAVVLGQMNALGGWSAVCIAVLLLVVVVGGLSRRLKEERPLNTATQVS